MGQTSTVRPLETPEAAAVEKAGSGKRLWVLILLSAAVAFYWMSLYLYVPTLPVYVESKTRDLALVGVILAQYGLWQAIVRLPLGISADWLGKRKPFLFVGFALSALGAWLMGSADGSTGLLIGRAVTGLAAATWVPLVVLFSSQFPAHEAVRATAILSLINSISRVVATGATGTINNLSGGYGLAFTLAVGLAVLAIVVTLPVREIARAPKRPSLRAIGILITRRDVLLPALISAVGQYINWATTFGFLPILAKNLGASGELQSLMVSLNLGISMAGNLLVGAISRRFGHKNLVIISLTIMVGGVVFAALAQSIWMIVAAQALVGFGAGIGYPLYMGMSIEKVSEQERATAMGLHQAVYAIGMFAGPSFSGVLADAMGIQPMFGVTAAGCLIIGLLLAQGVADRRA